MKIIICFQTKSTETSSLRSNAPISTALLETETKNEVNNIIKAEESSEADLSIVPKLKPKVAVAITVTKDGNFVDGALVLGYSAKKYHSFEKGFPSAYGTYLLNLANYSRITWHKIESLSQR